MFTRSQPSPGAAACRDHQRLPNPSPAHLPAGRTGPRRGLLGERLRRDQGEPGCRTGVDGGQLPAQSECPAESDGGCRSREG